MDVDASLKIVGLSGRLQNINFVLFGIGLSLSAIQLTCIAFTLDQSVKHYCKPPPGFTANQTTPLIDTDGQQVSDNCHMYEVQNGTLTENTTTCQNGWEYLSERGENSIVTDLDLVCSHDYLANLLTSIFFAGVLVGGSITGQAADVFGRRVVSMSTLFLIGVLGTAVSFTWNFVLMLVLRFLLGVAIPGNSLVGYVRAVEMFTPQKRLLGHALIQHFWSLGVVLVALLAYLLPNWRHLQLATSLMGLPVVLMMWFFSYESLRWLVQKGREDKADAILKKIAKSKNIQHGRGFIEKIDFSENVKLTEGDHKGTSAPTSVIKKHGKKMDKMKKNHGNQPSRSENNDEKETSPAKTNKKYTVLDLFKTKVLIKHTLIIFFCWFVMNLTYFGFLIYATSLAGNKYLNFFFIALVEVPTYSIDFFIGRRFGRRRPLAFFLLAGAVACLLTAFLPAETASGTDLSVLLLVVAMIGKFCTTAVFEVTLLLGTEVFPTMLRNIATGSSSTVGRISAMLTPFIVYLKYTKSFLPMTIFGSLQLVASGLVVLLPETNKLPLPETYEDAQRVAKRQDQETTL